MTMRCRAFSLIELLVAVAILALLVAVMLPSLSAAREAGRSSVCLSNLRQAFLACRIYADANRGFGPSIGEPYSALPNWGLVVQREGSPGGSATRFRADSVLVCPSIMLAYAQEMTRTYAMNATGHAGLPGDPDNYDDPAVRGHIRFDRGWSVGWAPLLLDSARAPVVGSGPPSSRTASVIDFRQPDQVDSRLGRFHARRAGFNAVALDGSVGLHRRVEGRWQEPLP
jgi:prepilin-type N-terminal cleavage/methylation domain-containing protein